MLQTSSSTSPKQPWILVAEDDADMAHVISFLLRREGYHVDVVNDGREALRRVRGGDGFDLIVLDVMMPYLSGLHVVREIRALPGWDRIPVVMVSGKGAEADVVIAIEAGADDYIVKPFRPKELVARIGGLLQRRRRGQVA